MNLVGDPAWDNILIWADRDKQPRVRITGQASWHLEGHLYAIGSEVQISGQGNQSMTLNMSIIADVLDMSGQGAITIPWNADRALTIQRIALVE